MNLALALAAGAGVHLLWSALVAPPRRRARPRPDATVRSWLSQAGLDGVGTVEFVVATAAVGLAGAVVAWLLVGPGPAAALAGPLAALAPPAHYRDRRRRRQRDAQAAWPRVLEELRVNATSLGRSIPQAMLAAGRTAPPELREAFELAEREWTRSTDFERTLRVLTDRLRDPVADAIAETLLVAHQVGDVDLDRRLRALAEDRHAELSHRAEARARQSGARFARIFVLIVPLGMAAVGLTIGRGRAAYDDLGAQLVVLVALAVLAVCWVWAGRMLRLPEPARSFATVADAGSLRSGRASGGAEAARR